MKKPTRATPEQIELATRLRMAFALVTRAQRQEVQGRLTPVQLSALHKVDMYGPLRLGDLAAHEQVAGPTMTRVVTSLDALGLVKREVDPTSARCSLVTITRLGRQQLDAVRRDRSDHLSCQLAKLTPEHQRILADALPALEALVDAVLPGDEMWPREVERARLAQRRPRAAARKNGRSSD
ncbi:MAG: MarR family transcriptional regulator [Myxococcaceae bacterium]|jgi:DNA-binding MarR family transcriptional regulator|nr:MarR family transcriptional regulator [Myxococcaceae bacterium]